MVAGQLCPQATPGIVRAVCRVFKGLGSRVLGLVTSPREADAWVDRYYTRSPT